MSNESELMVAIGTANKDGMDRQLFDFVSRMLELGNCATAFISYVKTGSDYPGVETRGIPETSEMIDFSADGEICIAGAVPCFDDLISQRRLNSQGSGDWEPDSADFSLRRNVSGFFSDEMLLTVMFWGYGCIEDDDLKLLSNAISNWECFNLFVKRMYGELGLCEISGELFSSDWLPVNLNGRSAFMRRVLYL